MVLGMWARRAEEITSGVDEYRAFICPLCSRTTKLAGFYDKEYSEFKGKNLCQNCYLRNQFTSRGEPGFFI